MTQDSHGPDVIIAPPPFPETPANSFSHHFSDASKTTPRATFGTKSKPKVAPKNTRNDKNILQEGIREKYTEIDKTLSQQTLESVVLH